MQPMSSPLPAPAPNPDADVAIDGWAALTVRVAWALLAEGVRVRQAVLRDARDHVLLHLDPRLPLPVAEDRASELVARFVARARRKGWDDPWPHDAMMPVSPRWRRALERSLTPLIGHVFRQHYGDGRSIEQLERVLQVDRISLEAARGSLREVLRRAGQAEGLAFESWPTARLDRMLRRIAAWSPGPCPPALEVADGHHRDHVAGCTRCERTLRLVRNEILTPADLVPPAIGARPNRTVRVLALHFHPDARLHRDLVARECQVPCFPVGDDLLLVDLAKPEPVHELVRLAAEVGWPDRDQLRGAVLEGAGRWSSHGLLGVIADKAELAVRSKAWGDVEGMDELPETLPDPPSARKWWIAVAAVAILGASVTGYAFAPPIPERSHPIAADFTPGRGGYWADFDVDDAALVTIVRETDGKLDVVLHSAAAVDKAQFATGDGGYRLHAMGSGALVASTGSPLVGLEPMIEAANASEEPLEDLAERIRTADPHADVQIGR
jgi:hypothetical protein